MVLFGLWAVLLVGALVGAGYSHYRYRVVHNRYYEHLFARKSEAGPAAAAQFAPPRSYAIPVLTLVAVGILMPVSLYI